MITMLANVFIPHVPASLAFRSYTPDVATAVLINDPVMSFLSMRALREGWVSGRRAVVFAVIAGMTPMLLLLS